MTSAQKRLRELRERQSKERQRMAELALVETLSDEQRSELDTLERSTPDLERQLRAAAVAVEDEDSAAQTRTANEPDAERRERIELRSRASLGAYLRAALSGQQVSGAEAELRAAAGVANIPLELWDVVRRETRQTDAASPARPTGRDGRDPDSHHGDAKEHQRPPGNPRRRRGRRGAGELRVDPAREP